MVQAASPRELVVDLGRSVSRLEALDGYDP
jgi:hypothetical protein